MKTKKPKNPRFEVYEGWWRNRPKGSKSGPEWRWRLFAKNGEIIASGEGFTRERDANRAVRAVIRAVTQIRARGQATIPPPTLNAIADVVMRSFDKKREALGEDRRPALRRRGRVN